MCPICVCKLLGSIIYLRFADKQIVRLQETPDAIPDGETPHTVSLLMHDKLVDAAKPGDRVEVSKAGLVFINLPSTYSSASENKAILTYYPCIDHWSFSCNVGSSWSNPKNIEIPFQGN